VRIQLNHKDEVSMTPPLSRQAGFQFLNTIRCSWHTWPAHLRDLAVPDCFLRGSIKSRYLEHVCQYGWLKTTNLWMYLRDP